MTGAVLALCRTANIAADLCTLTILSPLGAPCPPQEADGSSHHRMGRLSLERPSSAGSEQQQPSSPHGVLGALKKKGGLGRLADCQNVPLPAGHLERVSKHLTHHCSPRLPRRRRNPRGHPRGPARARPGKRRRCAGDGWPRPLAGKRRLFTL